MMDTASVWKMGGMLLVAIALAGCTAFPGGGSTSDEPPARGLVIQEVQLENNAIPDDGGTRLVLRVANTQPDAAENVRIDITNTGAVQTELRTEDSDSKCTSAFDSDPTDYPDIDAASQGVPTELLCVWDINGNGAAEGSYPLTVTVDYTNTLTMQQESPKITFDPDRQIAAPTTSRTYSNGELSMTVSYPPRLPSSANEFDVETSLSDVGPGRVVGRSQIGCEGTCATIEYSGSLKTSAGFTESGERCGTARFLEGESQVTTSCEFTGGDTGDTITTHNLRADASYGYQVSRELPLQVVVDD